MTASDALLLAININDSYLVDDEELTDMFAVYGIKGVDCLTGSIEQVLERIGYVLKSDDVNKITDSTEIGCILVKLFYSGEAQRFVSDEFINAVAGKVIKSKKYADSVLQAFTGGDNISDETVEFGYYPERAKPLLVAFDKQGLVDAMPAPKRRVPKRR